MKKILIYIQCLILALAISSCSKEAYEPSDLDYELTARVYHRNYNKNVIEQTDAQKAILKLDDMYHFYLYLEQPQITSFTGKKYSGCKVEEINNYTNSSESGQNYSYSFERTVMVGAVEQVLTYEIFYDLDRTVYYRLDYDADGNPMADSNGNPIYEPYYKDSYLVIRTAAGVVVGRNDELEVLLEYRAI